MDAYPTALKFPVIAKKFLLCRQKFPVPLAQGILPQTIDFARPSGGQNGS
jgi:hypothetical protein